MPAERADSVPSGGHACACAPACKNTTDGGGPLCWPCWAADRDGTAHNHEQRPPTSIADEAGHEVKTAAAYAHGHANLVDYEMNEPPEVGW
jgi:hypothetical protein